MSNQALVAQEKIQSRLPQSTTSRRRPQILHEVNQKLDLLIRLNGLDTPPPPHHPYRPLDKLHRIPPYAILGPTARKISLDPATQPELQHPATSDQTRSPNTPAAVDQNRETFERVCVDDVRQVRVE